MNNTYDMFTILRKNVALSSGNTERLISSDSNIAIIQNDISLIKSTAKESEDVIEFINKLFDKLKNSE